MARFKFNDDNVLVGLDIGSSSVRCVVSHKGKGGLEPLSFYEKKCEGLEEGRIVDFNQVVPAIGELLEKSEKMSNRYFSEVCLGLSSPFHSFQSYGMAALSSREVTNEDINLACKTACAVPIPDQHVVIHHVPQEFDVDGKKGILNPLGLSGLRLGVEVHIVTIPQFYYQDMTKVLKILGCTPRNFVHNLIAFGENLLDFNQKKEGVCFCDIGQTSSRLIVYHQGKILDMISIPIGARNFYSAVVDKFKISPMEAQKLQDRWGKLQSYSLDDEEQIEIEEGGDLFFSYKVFVNTLEKVAENLFKNIKHNIDSKNLNSYINTGYVFTGTVAFLQGFLEMAGFHLGQPCSYPNSVNVKEKNFKQVNTFAIAQQSYAKTKFHTLKPGFNVGWSKLKDLF